MQFVLDQKLYDTDVAVSDTLASVTSLPAPNVSVVSVLYRTIATGTLFLVDTTTTSPPYAGYVDGSRVIPLTLEGAIEFVAEKIDGATANTIFGPFPLA